jgi:hypothetical protein
MLLFWVLEQCRLLVDANVSEKHTVFIFGAEVVMLGSIYRQVYTGPKHRTSSSSLPP